jgi:hypothetical protein
MSDSKTLLIVAQRLANKLDLADSKQIGHSPLGEMGTSPKMPASQSDAIS